MKQLWILLLAVCCTLPVLGQLRKTDSTHPKAQKADSQRAGRTVPVKKQPNNNTSQTTGKPPLPKGDADKAIKQQSPLNAQPTQTDSGDKRALKPIGQQTSQDSLKGTNNATVPGAAVLENREPQENQALTPKQIQSKKLAMEQQLRKAHSDSIYAAHKSQIVSGLFTASLAINSNAKPDYSIYFPAYFYENSVNNADNGTIVLLHSYQNKDLLFYAIMGITLLLALIKILFPRYFNQVFWFFLHPNDRKNNVSEQIRGQNILPSLLLNLFFVLTGGLFLAQIIRPNLPGVHFWSSWALLSFILAGIYLVKYLAILLSGWVFGAPMAATIYNQIVFSINKIIGLVLLPATLLISYGTASALGQVFNTVLIIIIILLIYRYIASFLLIKGKLKVSAFHFILYLCAVEIIPLLLVYKVLLTNLDWFI